MKERKRWTLVTGMGSGANFGRGEGGRRLTTARTAAVVEAALVVEDDFLEVVEDALVVVEDFLVVVEEALVVVVAWESSVSAGRDGGRRRRGIRPWQ